MFNSFSVLAICLWPVCTSFSVLCLIVTFVYSIKFSSFVVFWFCLFFFIITLYSWFFALNSEGLLGTFTSVSYKLFRFGFILFICSEVLFFFGFFWCFFSNCLSPSCFIGSWCPYGFIPIVIDTFGYPLLNTILLLSSGLSVTVAHYWLLVRDVPIVNVPVDNEYIPYDVDLVAYGFSLTIFLGLLFLYFQFYEYALSYISFNSTVYGSIFFLLTGFHGFHVIVGLIMLWVSYLRYKVSDYSFNGHVGFELAVWYWHFVDVVWLFLYIFVYWYGS